MRILSWNISYAKYFISAYFPHEKWNISHMKYFAIPPWHFWKNKKSISFEKEIRNACRLLAKTKITSTFDKINFAICVGHFVSRVDDYYLRPHFHFP